MTFFIINQISIHDQGFDMDSSKMWIQSNIGSMGTYEMYGINCF